MGRRKPDPNQTTLFALIDEIEKIEPSKMNLSQIQKVNERLDEVDLYLNQDQDQDSALFTWKYEGERDWWRGL